MARGEEDVQEDSSSGRVGEGAAVWQDRVMAEGRGVRAVIWWRCRHARKEVVLSSARLRAEARAAPPLLAVLSFSSNPPSKSKSGGVRAPVDR